MKTFRAGRFIKANDYKYFQPELVNRPFKFDDAGLLPLLERANQLLGELNAFGELVPDVDRFIKLHVSKEANFSSRIEGTQTQMEDALLREDEVSPEKRNDWRELQNYIGAMNHCLDSLDRLPLSSRLLCEAHSILLQNVRGEHKMPGEFRASQNWIGGATPTDAAFVPPLHSEVGQLMGDLENFLHSDKTNLSHVLKIALAHYQFETIHPFLDGNGRIGRLMITLYFMEAGVLTKPLLYLSEFFEKNRSAYYDHLTAVRSSGDLSRWFRFFLIGIIETAQKSTACLRQIVLLKKECETERLPKLRRKMPQAQLLLQHLFQEPVIRPDEVARVTGQSGPPTYRLIGDFESLGILREKTGNARNRIFVFEEYLNLFR